MSGSPIIQDGRFVGAVTHMFVEEPKRCSANGSGNVKKIFIKGMKGKNPFNFPQAGQMPQETTRIFTFISSNPTCISDNFLKES